MPAGHKLAKEAQEAWASFGDLHFYADLRSPRIGILLRLLDQITVSRELMKIERFATLVFQAALGAVLIILRIGLQVGIVRERLLGSPLNNRLAVVIGDGDTGENGCHAARLQAQSIDRGFQVAESIPHIVGESLTAAIPIAMILALIEGNSVLTLIVAPFHVAAGIGGEGSA